MSRLRALPAALSRARLGILFLVFPGLYLPLDLIYALPGILTYATADQAATIFLYLFALHLVAALVACALALVASASAGGSAAVALWLGLSLAAFGLGRMLAIWTATTFGLSPGFMSAGKWAALVVCAPAGLLMWRGLGERTLDQVRSILRAGTAVATLLALGCAGVVGLGRSPETPPAAPIQAGAKRPPIVLLTIDTLSAPHLPIYGYERPTAPRLAAFSRDATLFERSYASSNFTPSSVASLLYAQRPWTHRVIQHEGRPLAALASASLPELLQRAGYYGAAVTTNPWAAPGNLGVERFFSALSEHNVCGASDPLWVMAPDLQTAAKASVIWKSAISLAVWATDVLGICEGRHFDPELAFAEARRLMAEAPGDRPLFLWVHVLPPHDPYAVPAPFAGMFGSDPAARSRAATRPPYLYAASQDFLFPGAWVPRYDEAVRYVDHHVGAFLEHLKRAGYYERSLIVVTSDHGEGLSKQYGGHGGPGLHEELIRIPLLIKRPGQREARRVEQPSESTDVAPTILELAGIPYDARGKEGVSLVPAMRGERIARPVFSMNFQQSTRLGVLDTGVVAMIEGRWKYVHYFGDISYPLMPELEDALYDLVDDPRELENRIPSHPAVAARMLEEIEEQLRRHGERIE